MIKRIEKGVRIYPDGREVCQSAAAGRAEYTTRRLIAYNAQGGACALCGKWMHWSDATTDHIQPRGMGGARRDDRQTNLQAVHALCNSAKGSKR